MDAHDSRRPTPSPARRSRLRSWSAAAAAVTALAALTACTAPAAFEENGPSPSSSASRSETSVVTSPTPTPRATAAPIEAPEVADDEIARAEFQVAGAGGVPESASIAYDALAGDPLLFEGACEGEFVTFRLTTAAVDVEKRDLAEATMLCGSAFSLQMDSDGYTGLVQLSIVDADAADTAWVRLRSAP